MIPRIMLLALFLLLSRTTSFAQLTANAGPDIAWCRTSPVVPVFDTPILGGPIIATGGTPPYTYSWTIHNQILVPFNFLEDEVWLLDSPLAMHPKFIKQPLGYPDSIFIYLKVTDAVNNVAYDTTILRSQSVVCHLGIFYLYKNAQDTIALVDWECMSNSPTILSGKWTTSNHLIDSNVLRARCYSPVDFDYHVIITDGFGCKFYGGTSHVRVRPTSVPSHNTNPHPVVYIDDAFLNILLPDKTSSGDFQLIDMNGRRVMSQAVQGLNRIDVGGKLATGIYNYRLFYDNMLYQGKVPVNP